MWWTNEHALIFKVVALRPHGSISGDVVPLRGMVSEEIDKIERDITVEGDGNEPGMSEH